MAETTRQIRLAARPQGIPRTEDFELAEVPLTEPAEGEVLVRNSYLSVDPYMRWRMREAKSYLPPFELGQPLEGGAVGQVIASRGGRFKEGDWVQGSRAGASTWSRTATASSPWTRRSPRSPRRSACSGCRRGVRLGRGRRGGKRDRPAGAPARLPGGRQRRSAEKVAWVRDELRFDGAFSYRDGDLAGALREHFPKGIDVYFDDVGGDHLTAALGRLGGGGRVAVCEAVSRYNEDGPISGPGNFGAVLVNRLMIKGFIVLDHFHLLREFLEEVRDYVKSGRLR